MRFSALIILMLIGLGSAEGVPQTSTASADYQAGFSRGLELGMEIENLLNAAAYNSSVAQLFNQRVMEINRELDQVFGNGSNQSKQYGLQPLGLDANNTITANETAVNKSIINETAVDNIAVNETAVNGANINQTSEKPALGQRGVPGNASAIAKGKRVDEDFGDIIKDWNGNPQAPPDLMAGMPGPETEP